MVDWHPTMESRLRSQSSLPPLRFVRYLSRAIIFYRPQCNSSSSGVYRHSINAEGQQDDGRAGGNWPNAWNNENNVISFTFQKRLISIVLMKGCSKRFHTFVLHWDNPTHAMNGWKLGSLGSGLT